MRTMVTGGEGFLGSYVVARLEDAGRDFFVVRHQDTDLAVGETPHPSGDV